MTSIAYAFFVLLLSVLCSDLVWRDTGRFPFLPPRPPLWNPFGLPPGPPGLLVRRQLAAQRAAQVKAARGKNAAGDAGQGEGDAKKKKKKKKKASASGAVDGSADGTQAPSGKKKKEKLMQPWMTPELLELIKERDKRHARLKKGPQPPDEEKVKAYKSYRNEVTLKIRSAKIKAGVLERKMKVRPAEEGEGAQSGEVKQEADDEYKVKVEADENGDVATDGTGDVKQEPMAVEETVGSQGEEEGSQET